jgi:hypothetical protein
VCPLSTAQWVTIDIRRASVIVPVRNFYRQSLNLNTLLKSDDKG